MHAVINGWFWDSSTTGSQQYTRRLVQALTTPAPELRISLVIPGRQRQALSPPCALHPVSCPRSNLGKVWFEQVAFPRACARLGAHVAHVPYWAPPLRSSVPVVATIHDLIPLLLQPYRGGPLQRLYTGLVSAGARGATLILTDSQASRQDILTHLQFPPERVRVIPLAADAHYAPQPTPEDGEYRAHYGLPHRYVLYLGGFDVRKNLAGAIATYRWVGPVIGQDCPLVIAGRLPERDTPFTPDPRRLMEEQGVSAEFVHFTGFVQEAHAPALYRGAVALIFPSRYEGFGLPPLEALACGTPVVGSDRASLPEVIGKAGVLLPPDDAEGMAGALIQLIIDEDFRAEMSRRTLAQSARFSWDRTAQATLAAYKDAINRGTAGDD
ncbi:MAG: glycosyltransferase family 1 protein [Anaerolineae bacterium]|jgi:glycosyltransferase involved in cell wall biosynthesis